MVRRGGGGGIALSSTTRFFLCAFAFFFYWPSPSLQCLALPWGSWHLLLVGPFFFLSPLALSLLTPGICDGVECLGLDVLGS